VSAQRLSELCSFETVALQLVAFDKANTQWTSITFSVSVATELGMTFSRSWAATTQVVFNGMLVSVTETLVNGYETMHKRL
jgi:BarA-like signal transduction histidine kinase